jgi:hypothetical protein
MSRLSFLTVCNLSKQFTEPTLETDLSLSEMTFPNKKIYVAIIGKLSTGVLPKTPDGKSLTYFSLIKALAESARKSSNRS